MRRKPLKDKPYTVYTVEGLRKRRRRRLIAWVLAAIVVLVIAIAGGAYWWLYGQLSHTTTQDSTIGSVVGETLPESIDPPTGMDILVLGADKRANAEEGVESRSDTVILVHVDPDNDYLSLLSLPRDLWVEIPGHGLDKLNSAYAFEGPSLTVKTVQQLTEIDIEQYVQVDFAAFKDLTDALGGVYVDVDRRYYYDSADQGFEAIKLSPGYQLLSGADALDYVRFRHDSNYDFGRMERQQQFISAAREQISGWNLALKLPGLIKAITDNVETTLTPMELQKLALWALRLDGSRIRQISITGDTVMRETANGQKVSVVIPADGAVKEAVHELLSPPSAGAAVEATSPTTGEVASGGTATSEDTTSFVTDPAKIENAKLWGIIADSTSFPVLAPGYLPPGYKYVDRRPKDSETYEIVPGKSGKPGLKLVYQFTNSKGVVTEQYMGIMETSWTDAPAAGPGQKIERNGTIFTVVGTNQKVERIWWKANDTLYWVSNTLSFYLSKKELLKVAESMIAIPRSR